jgi:hypothetical protein
MRLRRSPSSPGRRLFLSLLGIALSAAIASAWQHGESVNPARKTPKPVVLVIPSP